MRASIHLLLSAYRENRKLRTGVMLFAILSWLCMLYPTDSFLSPYIVYALAGIIAFAENVRRKAGTTKREKIFGVIFAGFFSSSVFFANYQIFLPVRQHLIAIGIILTASFLMGWHILIIAVRMGKQGTLPFAVRKNEPAKRWFWVSFMGILIVYLLTLFFCYRPGILSPDSIVQIEQIMNGVYSNHHPFWHTMIIKAVMGAGQFIFHDINRAVLFYSIFQILCMAAIFALICMTMYQAKVRKGWIIMTAIYYAIVPYHLLYSMTMWKDVLFGGTVALFVCALYRHIKEIGSRALNYAFLVMGAMGSCLLRSNGWAAFAMLLVLLVLFLRSGEKKMLLVLLTVVVLSFGMKHPLLNVLGVRQPDLAEHLSIPEQQIARLITEEVPLSEKELQQIGYIMDIEEVRRDYIPWISDPVKIIIRRTHPDYLNEHKWEYFTLWLRLGLRYPQHYFQAWIDETKGYWNGGYRDRVVISGLQENPFGIVRLQQNHLISGVVNNWVNKFLGMPVFEIFRSIGFHVWIVVLTWFVLMIRKRKEGIICILPIAVILSLLISTPVSGEFRYAYAVFTAFPLIVLSTFCTL